jgi:hypothetical protein
MNASPHHSKVKVSLTLGHSIAVAGEYASGKMEVECRAEKALGISVIIVELVAIQGTLAPSSKPHSLSQPKNSLRETTRRRLPSCTVAVYSKVPGYLLPTPFNLILSQATLHYLETTTRLSGVYLLFFSASPSRRRRPRLSILVEGSRKSSTRSELALVCRGRARNAL